MNKYTEAIQRDDVVILCDGIPMGVGELLVAPVPQPADDFRARLIALCQQWTPSNLDRIESCEEIIRAVAEGPHRIEMADAELAEVRKVVESQLGHAADVSATYVAFTRDETMQIRAALRARAVPDEAALSLLRKVDAFWSAGNFCRDNPGCPWEEIRALLAASKAGGG